MHGSGRLPPNQHWIAITLPHGLSYEVLEAAALAERLSEHPLARAVLEAAAAEGIRPHDADEVRAEYRKLRVLVEKTGGPAEHTAFDFLTDHVERALAGEVG